MTNVHRADQLQAAGADAERMIYGSEPFLDGTAVRLGRDDAPPLVRKLGDAINVALTARTTKQCIHMGSPRPIFIHAARPDLLLCGHCFVQYLEDLDEIASWTCDECGGYFLNRLRPNVVQTGTWMLHWLLCKACQAAGLRDPEADR